MRRCGIRKAALALLLWGILLTFTYKMFKSPTLRHTSNTVRDEIVQTFKSKEGCIHPDLPLFDKTFPMVTPQYVTCSIQENWIYISNGSFRISRASAEKFSPITCKYIPIIRTEDDRNITDGKEAAIKDGEEIKHDAFRVECKGKNDTKYENVHSAISLKEDVLHRRGDMLKTGVGLNILMFGFDSVSRFQWMRSLPKTYEYFTKTLKGVVLQRYNIRGDGTTNALLPILTGKTEIELPEARRGFAGAKAVDDHPWIWKQFSNAGYVTQWGEEGSGIGAFSTRMMGFKKPPVDYSLSPFYLAVHKFQNLYKLLPNCVGSVPRHINMLNWIADFYHMYQNKRKFSFVLHSEYTHCPHPTKFGGADSDVRKFLEYMEQNNYLNNTLLILMADHGPRYGERNTIRGKYEERLPFFSFRFPPWFEKKYPSAMANLNKNAHRLTNPFDIHATLEDLLNFTGTGKGKIWDRGISLLKEIPLNRTCAHAQIPAHYCACLQWESVNTNHSEVLGAAQALVNDINGFTSAERDLCENLTLSRIPSAVRYAPTQGFLKFKQSKDAHRRVPDLSGLTSVEAVLYQITIVTSPGSAIYEATITHQIKLSQFNVSSKAIRRLNKYGNQPHCVMERLPRLRPYCYCKIQQS